MRLDWNAGRGLCLRLGKLAALAAALAVAPFAGAEGPSGSLEYPVKASLLLNFAKFTEWPAGSAQASSPSVAICVLGSDPFGATLDEMVQGRTVAGRGIVIKRYREAEGTEACHVLFIALGEADQVALALSRVRATPVLTVGESPAFGELGGVICLVVENNHAGFAVNLGATATNRLRLSSKLLGVARAVRSGEAR